MSSLLLCGYFCGLRLWAQQPPAQNYVLGLSQYQIAAAPLVSASNLSDPFTMEGWLFLEVASPNAVVMGKAHSPSGSNPNMSWALILDGTGRRIQFQESTGQAGSLRTVTNTTGLPLFQWVHVAATLSSGTMQLFVNGQLVGSAMSAGAPENAAVPFALGNGANPDGSVANTVTGGIGGALSQVSLWNRALSATELQSNLGKYLQGTEPGLAAYWPLDGGPGQTVRDLGPNHVNLYFGSSGQPNTFQPSWFPTAILNNGPYFSFTTGQISTPPAYVDAARLNQGGNPGFLLNLRAMPPSPFRFLGSDGKGNFSEATAAVLGSVQTEPLSPYYEIGAVADFNGDGRQDVLIANPGPDALPFPGGQSLLLMQTAAGMLSDETASRLPLQNVYATAVGAADVDGDGSVDVYLSSFGSPTSGPEFLMNDGTGHFTADASRLPPSIAQTHYQTVGFSDVNQDGTPDLILGGAGGPAASDGLFLNDGTGVFSNAANPLPPRLGGSRVTLEVSSADFDGDGWPDLLMPVSGGTHDPSIGGLQLLLNNGDGTFRDASDRIPLMWARGTQIGRAIPIDFNHDGWMDIVTFGAAGQVPAAHHLFLNTGQGHFIDASAVLLPLTQNVTVYPGDFNGDGLIDLMYFGLLGQYTAALNLMSVNPVASAYAPVPGGPNLPLGSVLHGASFTQRGIAPGEIISIFGSRMGPTSGLSATANASGQLSTSLAGTSVLFDGVAAPLIYVKDDQINAIIPYSVAGKKTTMLQVQSGGIRSNALPLPVVPAAPGIFTVAGGKGQAVALDQDNTLNSPANPAAKGSVMVLWATGAGQTSPPGIDGQLATDYSNLPKPVLPVSVEIGGIAAQVLYAGAAPNFAGLLQLNVVVPDSTSSGPAVGLFLKVGDSLSRPYTTVAIQ